MFPTTLQYLESLRGKEKIRVLFVCLGNICRSPAAEGVMLRTVARMGMADRWEIDSAGTGNYHIGDLADPRMRHHAASRGLKLLHRARQVSVSDFDDFDLIIGMDASNLRNLRALSPTVETDRKIVAMSEFFPDAPYDYVPDPYYEGDEGFELVLDLLETGCRNLAMALTPPRG